MTVIVSTSSGASVTRGAQIDPAEPLESDARKSPSAPYSKQSVQLVTFNLDELRYALRLSIVDRIVRSVEITILPKAPEIVLGIINVQGRVIPVLNIRNRFRLPDKEISLSDHLIIAHTNRRPMALVADAVSGVMERSEDELTAPEKIVPGLEYVEGVVKFRDGLIFIHNLETFLSLEEENKLEQAMGAC